VQNSRNGVALAASVLAGFFLGCVQPPADQAGRVPPTELPAEVKFVLDNRGAFVTPPDNRLATVEPGTALDSLSTLDGCWGTYYRLLADGSQAAIPAGTPLVDSYESYHFDRATGAAKFQIYQQAIAGAASVFVAYEGHFVVLDQGRLRLTWEQLTFRNPATGQIEGETFTAGNSPQWDLRATLAGTELRLRRETDGKVSEDIGGAAGAEYARRVYARFDCP